MRLKEIKIKNYKSIDDLSLRFEEPLLPGEPDAFVIGSKNGIGKTSLLECCAWGAIAAARVTVHIDFMDYYQQEGRSVHLFDLMVRSTAEFATIHTLAQIENIESGFVNIEINENIIYNSGDHQEKFRKINNNSYVNLVKVTKISQLIHSILGLSGEPLLLPEVLFFNSYRKVFEGSVDINSISHGREMTGGQGSAARRVGVFSVFKRTIIHSLMRKSGLFEDVEEGEDDGDEALETLNRLMMEFVGGRIDKIRPMPDGALELRVMIKGQRQSISFDGLSSGQKEIIATLFLIWYSSRKAPCVVLIDEPELHLNAEWQRAFVSQLFQLAPKNQYILATHAEEVFRAVPERRRILLEP